MKIQPIRFLENCHFWMWSAVHHEYFQDFYSIEIVDGSVLYRSGRLRCKNPLQKIFSPAIYMSITQQGCVEYMNNHHTFEEWGGSTDYFYASELLIIVPEPKSKPKKKLTPLNTEQV